MRKPVVYLAGPIAGTKQGEAFEWREHAAAMLEQRGIETLSPMRAKGALRDGPVSDSYTNYCDKGWAFTPNGILTRDHGDVINSDAILMNVLDAKTLSFGTGMELAWAYDRHIRTVVAIEELGNPHDDHPMFVAAMKVRVATLDDAIDAVATILGR